MPYSTTLHATILFAHGSRDPLWRAPVEAVAERIRTQAPDRLVGCAYLELTEPDLPTLATQLIANGAISISLIPLFLGVGRHAREDLPLLVDALRLAHPSIAIALRPSIGEDARLLDLIADIAIHAPVPEHKSTRASTTLANATSTNADLS